METKTLNQQKEFLTSPRFRSDIIFLPVAKFPTPIEVLQEFLIEPDGL